MKPTGSAGHVTAGPGHSSDRAQRVTDLGKLERRLSGRDRGRLCGSRNDGPAQAYASLDRRAGKKGDSNLNLVGRNGLKKRCKLAGLIETATDCGDGIRDGNEMMEKHRPFGTFESFGPFEPFDDVLNVRNVQCLVAGSVIRNVQPVPFPRCRLSSPPLTSTTHLAIDKPSPAPPTSPDAALCSR